MRIAALSDFHVGATERRDAFRHDIDRFAGFLDGLEATHDVIVLVGDIYQTDHGLVPGRVAARRDLHRARSRLSVLCRRFDAEPYRYVHGNHDLVAASELGATETLRLEDDGIGIVFIHGHQFDPVARRAKLAADAGTWLMGRIRSVGLAGIARWFEYRDVLLKDRRFGGLDGPYVRSGRRLARDNEAAIVVMGHTHVASLVPVDEGLVANTGTCSAGRFEHVSIDTSVGEVALRTARFDATDRVDTVATWRLCRIV